MGSGKYTYKKVKGPIKVKKADGSETEIGEGAYIKVIDGEVTIELGAKKSLVDQIGSDVMGEISAEVPSSVLTDSYQSVSLSFSDAYNSQDFMIKKVGGVSLGWDYVEGAATLRQSLTPARTGFTWVGFKTDNFRPEDIINIDKLEHCLMTLDFIQWTPSPTHDYEPTRISVLLKNVTTSSIVDSYLSGVIDPAALKPVVTCVDPRTLQMAGGEQVTIEGDNFQSGAQVLFGRDAATSVTVVSANIIVATSPSFIATGKRPVIVVQSGTNGARCSAGCAQAVTVS